ncbi:MAG: hypothetical protein HN368_17510 [Spirochaetales bacterium]|nr:hypothetical protein [Spirochaetales bacterium]
MNTENIGKKEPDPAPEIAAEPDPDPDPDIGLRGLRIIMVPGSVVSCTKRQRHRELT